ncbi:MAG: GPP34 family phosphoprotein [Bacteroidetes bacterium]|nr:GPP34 family phosphoprotein [Bacteroidota bacterium]
MQTDYNLHLYEKIFLLALKDKEGTFFATVNYRHALAGAMLAELLLKQYVSVENVRKRKYLKLETSKSSGDVLLDACLKKIAQAKRRAQLQTWVQRFSGLKSLKQRTAKQLCRKGILKEKEEKVLFFFKHRVYPEVNPKPEKAIIDSLEKTIFGSSTSPDPETVILISICQAVHLLPKLFDRKRLKEKKQRIKQLTEGELMGKATQEAIEAMQAAIMITTIMPAVAATST